LFASECAVHTHYRQSMCDHWQNKVSILSAYDSQELTKLETKCRGVLTSQESLEVKQHTVQMWLEPIIRSDARSHKKQ
ncbi:MAG: hypothetical protein EBY22_11940, partial [Gammaproteobacteria bacterium]|nr:hypothetical protein [Gammaproteobacteria bacterium]